MPSATKAHPEYEFSTVMQHGMSPPPTLATRWTPMTEDNAVVAYMRLVPRPTDTSVQNKPNMLACAAAIATLSMFFPGRAIALEDRFAFSFPNAIKLPVKVIPPDGIAK